MTYFGAENVIEWVCYVTAILFVIDFTECQEQTGLRLNWQWQIGKTKHTVKEKCLCRIYSVRSKTTLITGRGQGGS